MIDAIRVVRRTMGSKAAAPINSSSLPGVALSNAPEKARPLAFAASAVAPVQAMSKACWYFEARSSSCAMMAGSLGTECATMQYATRIPGRSVQRNYWSAGTMDTGCAGCAHNMPPLLVPACALLQITLGR